MSLRPSATGSALLALLILAGCARELPPPGARPDEAPPRIELIEPEPETEVPGFDDRIRLRFDEPVRVPQDLERRLFVSPMEPYEIESGFSDIRLRPRDGWRDSVIYCLEIPEGISDLLSNRTTEPTSFCFSTGGEIPDTRVSGTVLDALTGTPVNEARVVFYAPADSTPYGALADQEGAFSARALVPGPYQAFAFVDQNRNFTLDRAQEAHDSVSFEASPSGAPSLEFSVVPPDTTPPILLRVASLDSVTIELEFDDPLIHPPAEDPRVTVRDSTTGVELTVLAARVGQAFEADLPELPADSAAAPDSLAAEPDSLPPAPAFGPPPLGVDPEAGPPGAPPEAAPAGPPLPSRFVSVRTAQPFAPGTYHISTGDIVNLRRLVGSVDTTFVFELEATTETDPDLAPPFDSLAALQDTTIAPPDTTPPPPDTLTAPPDTVLAGRRPAWPRGQARRSAG